MEMRDIETAEGIADFPSEEGESSGSGEGVHVHTNKIITFNFAAGIF
jgi:hypothetical protein